MMLRDAKPPGYRKFCVRFRCMRDGYRHVFSSYVDASSRDHAESLVASSRAGCVILPPIKRNRA